MKSNSKLFDIHQPSSFGSPLIGRQYEADTAVRYRFGFNGKENDNEVMGDGNQQDYGIRISDPRLGRFLSVDPIAKDFPMLTPYQYASNMPIAAIDIDGMEAFVVTITPANGRTPEIRTVDYIFVLEAGMANNPNQALNKPVLLRQGDNDHPEWGTTWVQYRYKDANGNVINTENQADFKPGSPESFVMNEPETYSLERNMNNPHSGTIREAMGKYFSIGGRLHNVVLTVRVVARFDNMSNKMQTIQSEIKDIVKSMVRKPNSKLVLIGYTDKDPMTPYVSESDPDGNKRLSEERAGNVKKVLTNAVNKISGGRIRTAGAGSVNANKTSKDSNDRKVIGVNYTTR